MVVLCCVFYFGKRVADQQELKRSLSRWLIHDLNIDLTYKPITHWFISLQLLCFLQHASCQRSSYLKQLPVYNIIFLLDRSAQHLQLSDLTLAAPGPSFVCLFVYCGGANKWKNYSVMVITYLKLYSMSQRKKKLKCVSVRADFFLCN